MNGATVGKQYLGRLLKKVTLIKNNLAHFPLQTVNNVKVPLEQRLECRVGKGFTFNPDALALFNCLCPLGRHCNVNTAKTGGVARNVVDHPLLGCRLTTAFKKGDVNGISKERKKVAGKYLMPAIYVTQAGT